MGTCIAAAVSLLSFGLCFFLQISSTTGACVDETIPPVVPPTTWTGWFSVDDPSDGTDDETLAAVRSVYPSVCASPTLAECRVKFNHTDHVTAAQSLLSSCTPAAGLRCQNSDQPAQETCLDYEIRFECPTPGDTLPDPHFHWDMSGKDTESDDDPISCGGKILSIYPNKGGMTGTVYRGIQISADSFNSSDHLCAYSNVDSFLRYGSAQNKCISETSCCTSGWTLTFWMRYRSIASTTTRYVIATGGQTAVARGFSIQLTRKFSLYVRGDLNDKVWEMKMASPAVFPADEWTHHCFTYNAVDGTRYYKNGVVGDSMTTETRIDSNQPENLDDVVMFATNDPAGTLAKPEGDFSDFKMFYRTFTSAEVQTAYLRETSESNLVIHYLVENSTGDTFDVELECLAKSGSHPNITWYQSDDGAHFHMVSPSSNIDIVESLPNNYRKRSELKFRHWNSPSDVVIACEASDVNGSRGSVSKTITVPKATVTTTGQPTTAQTTLQPTTIPTTEAETTESETTRATTEKGTTLATTEKGTTRATTEKGTTEATTEKGTTRATTEKGTTRATTEKGTTEKGTTIATTEEETTRATTEKGTTIATTEAETTRATTEEQTTRATTEKGTTIATTEKGTTIATTEAETTRATTQIESTTADVTSAMLTTLESCSDGPVGTLQKAIRCSNANDILKQSGELQDSAKKSLQDFLKVIPTLTTQQLPVSETENATELVLKVYSKLTDLDENVSIEDHISVSNDVEDAMEYLAGTLSQGNCTHAEYGRASVSLCHSSSLSLADEYKYGHKVAAGPEDRVIIFEEELTFSVPKEDLNTDSVTLVILRKQTPVQEINGTTSVEFPEDTINNPKVDNTTSVNLNSAILTFSLFVNHKRYSIPVNFSLYHLQDVEDEFTDMGVLNATRKTACVYWEEGSGDGNAQWSTYGCGVTTGKTSSSCSCNHSSNFAVLMQVKEYKISEADSLALMWITYIGCCISIIMLLLTLAIYAYLWRRLRSDRIFIHSSLSVAILIAQVLFIGGIERTENRVVCKIIANLLHFFYLSVFGWMLVEGIHLYRKVIKVYGSENIKMYPYLLVGWGIPAAITLLSFGFNIEGYGTETSCWLDISSGLIWAFVGPALVVIAVNIVVFVMVLRIIIKSAELSNDKDHGNIKAGIKGAVVLLPILGLTWVFGLLAVNSATIVFQYLFAIFNSFQGLFIFLNQCAFNSEDQPAQLTSSSVTQNTEVPTVSDDVTKKHAALDDDLKEEDLEYASVEEGLQDLEKVTGQASNQQGQREPFEFYKLPPSANLNPLRRLHSNKVYPKFIDGSTKNE